MTSKWPSVALGAALISGLLSTQASADQRRDFMLDVQPPGTWLLLDYFGTGGQVTVEHRRPIYGSANDLTLSAGVVPTYPLGEVFLRTDLRILVFNFAASVAYRSVWRDLRFERGDNGYCQRCDSAARRDQDPLFNATATSDQFPTAEAEVSALIPFNDYLVMQSSAAARYEGRADRSFDWFYTSIYDHGVMARFEASLFLKERHWGGIGPYVQLLMLPRDDKHVAQWAVGFNAVTRLGLVARNDLLFLTFLVRPGDDLFGQHNYYLPVRALLIYRLMLEL